MIWLRWVGAPLLWAALLVLGDLWLYGTPAHPVFLRVEIELAKTLSAAGMLAAAFSFGRGEYLRRAWLLSALCMVFLLLRDIMLIPWFETIPLSIDVIRGMLVVLANASLVWGTFLLSRAWKVAGLKLPGTPIRRHLVFGAAVIWTLLIAGPAIVSNFQTLLRGDPEGLVGMASSIGDVAALILIAPLLFTALALRGGSLSLPWWLLTASMVGWLFYDATLELLPYCNASARSVKLTSEFFRALGCLLGMSAGLAQASIRRAAIRHPG